MQRLSGPRGAGAEAFEDFAEQRDVMPGTQILPAPELAEQALSRRTFSQRSERPGNWEAHYAACINPGVVRFFQARIAAGHPPSGGRPMGMRTWEPLGMYCMGCTPCLSSPPPITLRIPPAGAHLFLDAANPVRAQPKLPRTKRTRLRFSDGLWCGNRVRRTDVSDPSAYPMRTLLSGSGTPAPIRFAPEATPQHLCH
jgi:hypothetical protein